MQATYDVSGAQEFTVVGSDIESYGAAKQEAAFLAQVRALMRWFWIVRKSFAPTAS
jgi:hypothetical protein